MSDSQIPKVTDADFGKLTPVQKMYIKRVERFNKGRATEHVSKRSRLRYVGLFFTGSVLGIYIYTMYAMKQERLGEEYDQRYTDTETQQNH